ncbi:hypothetical protein ABK040_002108 [Willaertia magna]
MSYLSVTELVEVFTTQGSNSLSNLNIKNTKGVKRVYNKDIKSYVLTIEGSSFHITNVEIPKTLNTNLQIMHRYLTIQCYLSLEKGFQVELNIRDKKQIKKRLIFSSNFKTITKTQLHTQLVFPSEVRGNEWLNLCFDLQDIVDMSFNDNEPFYCLDRIAIGPSCEIRRILTTRLNPITEMEIPKKFMTNIHDEITIIDSSTLQNEEGCTQNKKKAPIPEKQVEKLPSNMKPHIAFGRRIMAGSKANQRPTTGNEVANTETNNNVPKKPLTANPRLVTTPATSNKRVSPPRIQNISKQNLPQNNILLISHTNSSVNAPLSSRYSTGYNDEDNNVEIREEDLVEETPRSSIPLQRPPNELYDPSMFDSEDYNEEEDTSLIILTPPSHSKEERITVEYSREAIKEIQEEGQSDEEDNSPTLNQNFVVDDEIIRIINDTSFDNFKQLDFNVNVINNSPNKRKSKELSRSSTSSTDSYNPSRYDDTDDLVNLAESMEIAQPKTFQDEIIETELDYNQYSPLAPRDSHQFVFVKDKSLTAECKLCNVSMNEFIEEETSRTFHKY